MTWRCSLPKLERVYRREGKFSLSLVVASYSRGIFVSRQVLRCLFTFFRQFNHFLYEQVQAFKTYVLLTLHAAEHRRAVTVEITELTELERHGPLGLITHIQANLLQQFSVF